MLALVLALKLSLENNFTSSYDFNLEFPESAEEFIETRVKGQTNPEVKKYVGALAGIMILHLILRK